MTPAVSCGNRSIAVMKFAAAAPGAAASASGASGVFVWSGVSNWSCAVVKPHNKDSMTNEHVVIRATLQIADPVRFARPELLFEFWQPR